MSEKYPRIDLKWENCLVTLALPRWLIGERSLHFEQLVIGKGPSGPFPQCLL